jgi:subtilisin family serine protease
MTDRKAKYMIALLVVGAVLLLAAGAVYLFGLRSGPGPVPEITPPASLDELAEQYPELAPILTDPELGSVYKEFLLAFQEGGAQAAQEMARKRGMLTPEGDIRVTLVLDTEAHAPLAAQLEAAGVTVVSAYRDRVNVAVPMDLIEAQLQAGDFGAIFTQLTELEHVIAVELPETRVPDQGAIEGEGVALVDADVWHQAGLTGAGLRIGVLDLGFEGHQSLLGIELPDEVPVATFGWYDEEEVHGTACAEIVHEVAPGAELIFAWYDGSDAAFGEAIDWLLGQGVDIISHSAGGLIGPRDGSEWDAQVVDDVAAQGVLWVNSAGNEGLAHYRGTFTDDDGDYFHEFTPGDEMLALYNNGFVKVVLSWDDDWEQASQDYELYLYDADGNQLAASQDEQSGQIGHEPVEGIMYDTGGETVYAVVEAYDVDGSATLDIFVYGADVEHPSPDHSICPPGDAVGSLTVGAVNWWDDMLAEYSSQGPTSDGRLKPEISAPAGVSGSTYGDRGFDGTSASCPHTAGAAALVWQAHPEFSRQEVFDFLLNHALDLGPSGPDTGYGYGRLQLPEAPSAPPPTPEPATPTPTTGTTPVSPPSATPTSTPAPLSTPTPFDYVTPTPAPPPPPVGAGIGAGETLLALTGVGLLVGGLGCAGAGLLLVGAVGLVTMGRRARRARPMPPPIPPPMPPTPPWPQPMRCRSCGASVRADARFCPACGSALTAQRQPRYCRHCGAPLREGTRFCSRCGRPVGS